MAFSRSGAPPWPFWFLCWSTRRAWRRWGAIKAEYGGKWMGVSAGYQFGLAVCGASVCFQLGWHEIHPVANHVQKGVRQSLEDKLDQVLGQPTTCPHGEPIPTRTGQLIEPADRPLIVVPPGARGQISRVRTRHSEKLQYLAEIGCLPGVPFELVRREPFNGPLWLSLGRGEQVIGGEVGLVWVRLEAST